MSELFELAKLDAPEHGPECEPFSVMDLVQDVVQKFKLRAEQSEIGIDVDFNGTVPLVSGDIALVDVEGDEIVIRVKELAALPTA